MASAYPELVFSSDEAFDEKRLNAAMAVIDARLRALEPFAPSWQAVISELQAFGLKRLNDALQPVYDQIIAISQLGVVFSASSASELTVATGAQTLVLSADDRARFAAAAYIGVMKADDASVQMSGHLVSYLRDAGVLIIDVDHVAGAGTYSDWRVSASVDGTIFQAVVDDLAQDVAAALASLGDALEATTDASNLTRGLLPAARLPAPTGTALGGVKSATAGVGHVMTGIDTSGAPVFGGAAVGFRNLLRNAIFAVNQRALSGVVTLAAGAYGHDGVKAGASGATYTFATDGIDTTITVTSGSLILPIEAALIEGGAYTLSQAGTAQARVWQGTGYAGSGSYAAAPFAVTGLTANTQTNVEFSTGAILRPQLETGSVATPFERRPPGVELALCQRYYEVIRYNPAGYTLISSILSAASSWLQWRFAVAKRSAPTFAIVSGAWSGTTPAISTTVEAVYGVVTGGANFFLSGYAGNIAASASAEI